MAETAPVDWNAVKPAFEQPVLVGFPSEHKVRLRHPGYPDSHNTLFHFNAYDHTSGGVDRLFAFTACGVVTGNIWTAYFSQVLDGPPIQDEVLKGNNFYFHPHLYSPDRACLCRSQPYPVYPQFSDWQFPRQNLPPWWPSIPATTAILPTSMCYSLITHARDQSCRLTGCIEASETAHIIPKREESWFAQQNMHDLERYRGGVDGLGNLLLLRSDVHLVFDQLKWVMFPKEGSTWVYYALDDSLDLASVYHNRSLRPIHGVRAEYLLVGFARAIFPWLNTFIRDMKDKYLFGTTVGTNDAAGVKVSGAWCFENILPPGQRTRNNSPKKRQSPNKRSRSNDGELKHQDQDLHQDQVQDLNEPRIRKLPNPAFAGPCICLVLPLTPSASGPGSSHEDVEPPKPSTYCLSRDCPNRKDIARLEEIRQRALEVEREKSDVTDWWKEQVEWAQEALDNNTTAGNLDRFFWARGEEVLDNKGEYVDTKAEFLDNVAWEVECS